MIMASVSQPAAPAAGKGKGKKSKGQKLDIDEFVVSGNFKMPDSSWADIMEDEAVIVPQHLSLPSAPKSALGPEIDLASIPSMGPYKAHVTNLQYEVTEEQLTDLFKGLNIVSLRLHSENGRPNGTANVEFGTRNDLIDALNMSQKMLSGRAVKIYLPNQDRYGGMGDGRRGGGRGSYTDNTPMNWRAMDRTAPPSRGDDSGRQYPPKSERVFPPPTTGFGADRGYGNRAPRREGGGFGDGDGGGGGGSFRNPGNNFAGGYGDRSGAPRRDGDEGGYRRGPQRSDRYGGGGEEGRSGNWGNRSRGGPEGGEPETGGGSNWRSARTADESAPASVRAPPPSSDYPRRDNRGESVPQSSRDPFGGATPRNTGGGEYGQRRPPRTGGEDDLYAQASRDFDGPAGEARPTRGPREDPFGGAPQRRPSAGEDYELLSRASVAGPRERTTSGRSVPGDELAVKDGEGQPLRRARPLELRPERLASLLGGGEDEAEKPSSYSSIFGGAKPVDTLKKELEIEKRLAEEKAAAAEKEAAAREAAAAASGHGGSNASGGTSPAGSQAGESTRPHRGGGHGDRMPRGDGPPRLRKENGEGGGPPRDDRRRRDDGGERRHDNRGPRSGYDNDRNGDRGYGGGDRRRGGGGQRIGDGGGGLRGRRDGPGGPRGDGAYFGGGGERAPRYGGNDRREGGGGGGGNRFSRDDGPSERYYGNQRGGGGGRDFDREYRDRFISDGDDKDITAKSYVTSNKYDFLNADGDE